MGVHGGRTLRLGGGGATAISRSKGRLQTSMSPFIDIIEASDSIFAFAGYVEARKGKWGGFADGSYINLGMDDQSVGPLKLDITAEIALLDFVALYRVGKWSLADAPGGGPQYADQKWTLDLLAGGRYMSIGADFDFKTAPDRDRSKGWLSPIIGGRVVLDLTKRLALRVKNDIGGFGVGADFIWQG